MADSIQARYVTPSELADAMARNEILIERAYELIRATRKSCRASRDAVAQSVFLRELLRKTRPRKR
jgi:hypothetical protein